MRETYPPVLRVEHLNIWYGSQHAVMDLSLSVLRGETFGLLGPNGAGKTSTLSAVEGLVTPRSGAVWVAGRNVQEDPVRARAAMGVQLQATSFQPELRIDEIVRLYAGLYGVQMDRATVQRMLREIQLEQEASKRFGQLSGGQQQRLSLLIACIHSPQLLLLDEPTAGLDPQSRRQLWRRMDTLRAAGCSIVLTTHSMEEAESVCDHIAILDHGSIVVMDTPQGLIERHRDDPRVRSVSRGGKITLEDVFVGLTGQEIRA